MLTISQRQQEQVTIFQVDGRVDTDGALQLETVMKAALQNECYILVLDLSKTNYLNSSGLRTLADMLTQCRKNGGDLRLAAPIPKVMRLMEIVGFDMFFKIYPNVEAAVRI